MPPKPWDGGFYPTVEDGRIACKVLNLKYFYTQTCDEIGSTPGGVNFDAQTAELVDDGF